MLQALETAGDPLSQGCEDSFPFVTAKLGADAVTNGVQNWRTMRYSDR